MGHVKVRDLSLEVVDSSLIGCRGGRLQNYFAKVEFVATVSVRGAGRARTKEGRGGHRAPFRLI